MDAETRLRLCEAIVDGTPDAVIFADAEGVIRLWNAGAAAIFGYSAAEAIGQRLDLIIPERLRSRHWEGYERVMATGETHYGSGELLSVPSARRDGTRISLEFSIAMQHDASGKVTGIGAILRDVSERWQQERQLRARIAELEAKAAG